MGDGDEEYHVSETGEARQSGNISPFSSFFDNDNFHQHTMFEELEAKRVCRADLRSRSSSPSSGTEPDEEIQGLLQSRLAELYGPIITALALPDTTGKKTLLKSQSLEDVSDEGFEFRLFATSKDFNSPSLKAGKIILDDDDKPSNAQGGFIVSQRDSQYSFTGKLTAFQRQKYEMVAVSGKDVLRGLQIRHTGLEVPWRVSTIKLGVSDYKKLEAADVGVKDEEKTHVEGQDKRKRMGKKMRILRRKREEVSRELRLLEQQKLASKDAAEREKRTRRNKEKQRKKRMKEKAKKAGANGEIVSIPTHGDTIMDGG